LYVQNAFSDRFGHGRPPFAAPTSTLRVRVSEPLGLSQKPVHGEYAPQLLTTQFTGGGGVGGGGVGAGWFEQHSTFDPPSNKIYQNQQQEREQRKYLTIATKGVTLEKRRTRAKVEGAISALIVARDRRIITT
jgi:hypothetical protein